MEEGEKITEKEHVFITETKIAQILVSGICLGTWGRCFRREMGKKEGRHHLNVQAMVNKTNEVLYFDEALGTQYHNLKKKNHF